MNTIKLARNILESAINAVGDSTKDYFFFELKEKLEEIKDQIESRENDFCLELNGGEFRVIHSDDIDEIQVNEMKNDEYILGCFTTEAVVHATGLPYEMINACKEAEAFEAIGKGIIALGKVEELQQYYVSCDGYGNHFAGYDHQVHDISFGGELYHGFRTN